MIKSDSLPCFFFVFFFLVEKLGEYRTNREKKIEVSLNDQQFEGK
jgi:hypothetical protein